MNDNIILDKIRSGENEWIRLAYQQYRKTFISWIGKLLKIDQETAADLFQSSLLTLYENVLSGQLNTLTSSVQTYLFAIGRNKGYEYLHRKSREQKLSVYEFSLAYDDTTTNEQEVAYQETSQKLLQTIDLIGEPCLPLLRMFYYERKSWEQISSMLGYKTMNSAKTMKYKCMKKIKDIMLATKTAVSHG